MQPLTAAENHGTDLVQVDAHQTDRQVVRQALHDAGVSLQVMLLNASKFYHLGTMEEFIAGTCTDKEFMSELHIHNTIAGIAQVHTQQQREQKHAGLQPGNPVQAPIYIENSLVPSTAVIQPHSIIVDSDLPTDALVLRGTCMFTLQLQEFEFVTLTFSVKDDMKKAAESTATTAATATTSLITSNQDEHSSTSVLQGLYIFERVPVSKMVSSWQGTTSLPLAPIEGPLSLWRAPVFEIARSRDESVRLALNRLGRIQRYLQQPAETKDTGEDLVQPFIVGWTSLKAAATLARRYHIPPKQLLPAEEIDAFTRF